MKFDLHDSELIRHGSHEDFYSWSEWEGLFDIGYGPESIMVFKSKTDDSFWAVPRMASHEPIQVRMRKSEGGYEPVHGDLFLWRIAQNDNRGYDTYDSAVVVAATEEEARSIHPSGDEERWRWPYNRSWADSPEKVECQRLGLADFALEAGTIILASFNAG